MTHEPATTEEALEQARAEVVALRHEVSRLRLRLAEVELLADRDPLVPMLNRRAFQRELSRTIAFCERYDATASLVFFDMDAFKEVNDRFGHAGGDAALQAVGRTLVDNVRESDVVGRIGGDEFAVILAQAAREPALNKALDLQRLVEAQPASFEGRAIPLRLSFGVRTFEKGVDAVQMMAEADAAMFVRKSQRRGGAG